MLGRTGPVRGPAAFMVLQSPRAPRPIGRTCPSGEKLVFRRSDCETGWEQFLSYLQVSAFHQELIEHSL